MLNSYLLLTIWIQHCSKHFNICENKLNLIFQTTHKWKLLTLRGQIMKNSTTNPGFRQALFYYNFNYSRTVILYCISLICSDQVISLVGFLVFDKKKIKKSEPMRFHIDRNVFDCFFRYLTSKVGIYFSFPFLTITAEF